jgi:predicted nucleic acid-binding protein
MVAAVSAWHVHHQRATREIERRLADGEVLVVPAPALVETYAVLTRLPPPTRLSPADASELLAANFMNDVELVALDPGEYSRVLRNAPSRRIAGGAIYDAVVHACGLAVQAEVLLTFNERQFKWLAGGEIEVVVPPIV